MSGTPGPQTEQYEAVRRFEAVYTPELVGGPVVFTDYVQIASNRAD